MTNHHRIRLEATIVSSTVRCSAVLALGLLLGACSTDVVNPGNVDEESLTGQAAQPALVRGAGRTLAQGLNWLGYTGAAVAREIHPAGSTGSFGITNLWQNGELRPTDGDLDDHWEFSQRGRWTAEQAVRFINETGPINKNTQQQALLFAGFANRVLGDNQCEAVIDGGQAQPNAVYWTRAEDYFTQAIAVQTGTMETAAYGGRAQARLFLGKWAEAVADAARVPTDFSYTLPYYNVGSDVQRNRIAFAVADNPYRAHTQWNTWYFAYWDATKDPRVATRITTQTGDAAIDCCGRVAFYPQDKYPNAAAAIRLTSGREMRLIEAEAKLRSNDVPGAIASINAVRMAVNVATVTAADATEAWTLLKRERGIELWLEGRRLGDLRRWKEANTPGALSPLEQPGTDSHLVKQDLCFPIAKSERDTNPNLR